jgi:YVTN family beta-propeller protein
MANSTFTKPEGKDTRWYFRRLMKTKFANLILCLTLLAGSLSTCVFLAAPAAAQAAPTYSIVRTMLLGGDGGWDYLYADSAARRLYIARATRFMVVDLDSGKQVGEIPDTPGAHGVALVPDLGIGFTTNGRENMSSVFDLKTLKVSEKINTGEGPDAIVYDPASGNIFTMNGHGKSASVIDPKSRKVVATIPLSGKPETPVADGKGRLYINIEDKNSIAVVDTKANKVIAEWPMAGCDEPSGLDMDRDGGDLFAACGNKLMAIVDSKTGKLITTIPTGDGSDGLAFAPKEKVAVTSNGEGNMSFVGKRDGKYALLENVPTKKGARTIGFDASTGLFLTVSADLGPAPKPSPENPRGRPMPLPNSFVVIAVGRK